MGDEEAIFFFLMVVGGRGGGGVSNTVIFHARLVGGPRVGGYGKLKRVQGDRREGERKKEKREGGSE